MDTRSTNVVGYTHFVGDVTAQVGSSHGVRLSGGSTGGIVEAVGDDADVSLTVRGKGTGDVRIGASTNGISFMQAQLIQFTIPAMSTDGTAGASVQSTLTLAGATTNGFYLVQQRTDYNATNTIGVYVTGHSSAADELTLTIWNHGESSLSGSTASAYLLWMRQ